MSNNLPKYILAMDRQGRVRTAIVDAPGGSNIAVYKTGPMEYPIQVVVEPTARVDGREESFGGHLTPW